MTASGGDREDLVAVLKPKEATGVALATEIVQALTRLGLDVTNVSGQAYRSKKAVEASRSDFPTVMEKS